MTDGAPSGTPDPRSSGSKPATHLFWLGLAVFFLSVLTLGTLVLGPSSPIVISYETTRILSPLRSNGLPDYAAHVNQVSSVGVTPDNNAAVLIWEATWPGELNRDDYGPFCSALGMKRIPSKANALVGLGHPATRKRISRWLEVRQQDVGAVDEIIDRAGSVPWTSDQIPAMAEWIGENQPALDKLVDAGQRPQYFSPSPSTLRGRDESMITILLPAVHGVRSAVRALSVRAMWHIGEGRSMEAWRDLHACHKLGRLMAKKHAFIVSQLVGHAIESTACTGTQTLLHHAPLSGEEARQILDDLISLSGHAQYRASDGVGTLHVSGPCYAHVHRRTGYVRDNGDWRRTPI